MKTATVRELRNHYTSLFQWLEAGEEILITRRGKAVARLIPEPPTAHGNSDWSQSPAVCRERSDLPVLSAEESSAIRYQSGGSW